MGASYGWRARIGFVTPSHTAENNPYEFYLMAPPGVMLIHTTLGISGLTQEQYELGLSRMGEAIQALLDRRVDAIVQAGVPPIVTRAWIEDDLIARVQQLTSVPFVTDIGACIAAMRALRMSRVVMLTPFEDDLHVMLADHVAKAGITVVCADSLRRSFAFRAISSLPLGTIYSAAKDLYRATPDADGIWITGALMPSVGIIDALERDLGVPVVSSMQAMAWAGFRSAGVDDQVAGFGRLFTVGG
jgi:maleate isomerase